MQGSDKLSLKALAGMVRCGVKRHLPVLRQRYQAEESARVRLFGHGDTPSIVIVHTGRRSGRATFKVKAGGHRATDRLASLLGALRNQSIGIAKTENTRNLKYRNGIFSRACYREFVAPAGKPLQVEKAFVGMASSAMGFAGMQFIFEPRGGFSDTVSFTPQAGKDYEVITYRNGDICSVMVYEIQHLAGETRLVPIPLNY